MARKKEKIKFSKYRFRQARKHKEITLKDISEGVYIPLETLTHAAHDEEITPVMLDDIAFFLDVSIEYLRGDPVRSYNDVLGDCLADVYEEYGGVWFDYKEVPNPEKLLLSWAERRAEEDYLYDDDGNVIDSYDRYDRVKKIQDEKKAFLKEYLLKIGALGVYDSEDYKAFTFNSVSDPELSKIQRDVENSILKNIKRKGVK